MSVQCSNSNIRYETPVCRRAGTRVRTGGRPENGRLVVIRTRYGVLSLLSADEIRNRKGLIILMWSFPSKGGGLFYRFSNKYHRQALSVERNKKKSGYITSSPIVAAVCTVNARAISTLAQTNYMNFVGGEENVFRITSSRP